MRKKITLGFFMVTVAAAAVFFAVTSQAYPVATVNDSMVSARSFQKAATAAKNYYSAVSAEYGGFAATPDGEFESRMRQVALQALIEDELITAQLLTLFEKEPLAAAIDARVSGAIASSSNVAAQAIPELFGISVEDFANLVLAPQARTELLQAELASANIDFGAWLQNALQSAKVTITARDLVWQNGQVELSGEQSYTAEVEGLIKKLASTTEAFVEIASSTKEQ